MSSTQREIALKKALNYYEQENRALQRKLNQAQQEASFMGMFGNVIKGHVLDLAKYKSNRLDGGAHETADVRALRLAQVEDRTIKMIVNDMYFVMRQKSFDTIPQAVRGGLKDILKTSRCTLADFVDQIEAANPFPTKQELFNNTQTNYRSTYE